MNEEARQIKGTINLGIAVKNMTHYMKGMSLTDLTIGEQIRLKGKLILLRERLKAIDGETQIKINTLEKWIQYYEEN